MEEKQRDGGGTKHWRQKKKSERILSRDREKEKGGIIEERGISQMEGRKRKERYEEEKRACATHARASACEVCAFVLACLL